MVAPPHALTVYSALPRRSYKRDIASGLSGGCWRSLPNGRDLAVAGVGVEADGRVRPDCGGRWKGAAREAVSHKAMSRGNGDRMRFSFGCDAEGWWTGAAAEGHLGRGDSPIFRNGGGKRDSPGTAPPPSAAAFPRQPKCSRQSATPRWGTRGL
jgi:hypothetical protein